MADITVMAAMARDKVGKGSARATRREGRVPAVICGDGKSPLSISVERKQLVKDMDTGSFFTSIYDIQIDGQGNRVLPRDVQLHPVTDVPQHVDFLRIGANTTVAVDVPVEFINEDDCPGLRAGGVLNVVRYTVEVSCRPDLIPNSIVVDLANAEQGDSLHISAVELPDGVTPTITDRDFTIATIAVPTAVVDELADAAEGDGEDDAPEDAGGGEETEE
ncbi:MAG: 50S ribosomal protein L25/general stress protein Ctc [Alphaproteobacteria bacterium]|jgi:large subunit ribosomal protein L25|nr:50S ribosomal protein L25/general stress protein Ctc [Alphaproteobacteria bacterium]